MRLLPIDQEQVLAVVITDFGLVRTEMLRLDRPADPLILEQYERYFRWRMNKGDKPLFADEAQAKNATRLYNEVMVRHLVEYANFSSEDLFRTGLSKLLGFPEFSEATRLASSLSLFEDKERMRLLLRQCSQKNEMVLWIGEELSAFAPEATECVIIAIPYYINQIQAGTIALLGPLRLPYRNLFGLMQAFSQKLSETLTKSSYKYKISFRTASKGTAEIANASILLENQGRKK